MELVTKEDFRISLNYYALALADPRGRQRRAPSPGVQILSFSYSFRQNIAK